VIATHTNFFSWCFLRTILGSVSDYCTHHCSCPVLVVKQPKTDVAATLRKAEEGGAQEGGKKEGHAKGVEEKKVE
jgi:hypothetical protein